MLLVVALAGCSDILGLRDVSVVVDGSPPCPEGLDVLLNGGFEDPTSAWISDPCHSYFCPTAVIPPPDGMWSGCLGVTGALVETMSQKVSLPSGVKTLTLSGSICIDTEETDNLVHDLLSLDMLDGENVIARIGTLSNRDGAKGCSFKPILITKVPLPSDPGAAALRLRATQDGPNLRTTFYFDDLKLTVGCTP
jgi:hypothetical protein